MARRELTPMPVPIPHAFPIALKTAHGWSLLDLRAILCARAEDKYARLTLTDGSTLVVLHPLSDLEQRFGCGARNGDLLFLRPFRSCIVAMHHASRFHGKGEVELRNGERLPIGKRAWPTLIDVLGRVERVPSGS